MKLKLKYDFKTGLEAVKKASKTFPNGSGIYKFMDCNKKVLYVGKAKNLKKEYLAMLMIKVKPIGLSY